MSIRVINPFTQESVCELALDSDAAIDAKIADAVEAYEAWRFLPLAERVSRVRAGVERFRAASEETAKNVTLQMGKPLAQARGEVATAIERAEYMLSIAEASLAPDVLPAKDGFHQRIEHVPLGVVLDLAAWNYPLLIAVNVVVPALLAGNSVLIKHSAKTPLSGIAFETAFCDPDFPGLVGSLLLDHAGVGRVITDPRIAHVAFTGSVEGGRIVQRHARERFIDVGLELGGKDPAYVAADADLEYAVAGIVDGACYNAGQSCCAVERVYVHTSLHAKFVERAAEILGAYRLGDPLDDATTMGPLISSGAVKLLEDQVAEAEQQGAKLVCGGTRKEIGQGNFFAPTLIDAVPNQALVMQEESFGPILPVLAVNDDKEALAHMADTRFGLTASVWTSDAERAEHFGRHLDAGTIFQNRCDFLDPALPWTGYGDSGRGSTMSRYGFFGLTRRKAIHFRTQT